MKFEPTALPGIIRIVPTVHEDSRGSFMETWQARCFGDSGIDAEFVQENFSHSHNCTDYYAPEVDRSIRWDDPDIAIDWPLTQGEELILSDKDAATPNLKDAEIYP